MIIELLEICAECGDEDAVIELNTSSGEMECRSCGITGQLGQHEVLHVLMNLDD